MPQTDPSELKIDPALRPLGSCGSNKITFSGSLVLALTPVDDVRCIFQRLRNATASEDEH